MTLYPLYYLPKILEDGGEQNIKMLGCFTSKENAYQTIKHYKDLPGFSDKQAVVEGFSYGEGFFVDKITSGQSGWEGGCIHLVAAEHGIKIVPYFDIPPDLERSVGP